MRQSRFIIAALVLGLSGLAVPASAQTTIEYILISNGNSLPSSLEADVAAAGGGIVRRIPQIGVAVASSDDPAFAANMGNAGGLQAVIEDPIRQWADPQSVYELDQETIDQLGAGDDEGFFSLQWGLQAIGASRAWDAGVRGAGVRVAVLDSGIDADQPDLAANLNSALSASFVPGEHWNIRQGRFFNHGTHVAGTIAAADNGIGVIGVAPDAEIVAVKVLSEYSGSGAFSGVIAGIVYAADIDADVINMSLGAYFPLHIYGSGAAQLAAAFNRATNYAHQAGTTIVASAGNSAADRDHDADGLDLPADATHVLAISATAPINWFAGATFLDNLASYSNYGQSSINFAAPGGDFRNYPNAGWFYDMVLSTGSEAWYFSAGTSMAAPHASGVAALIIGMNGGSMHPDQVARELREAADDLGKPGNDDAYGDGRVSAGNLVN